jgi:hypothetical protein
LDAAEIIQDSSVSNSTPQQCVCSHILSCNTHRSNHPVECSEIITSWNLMEASLTLVLLMTAILVEFHFQRTHLWPQHVLHTHFDFEVSKHLYNPTDDIWAFPKIWGDSKSSKMIYLREKTKEFQDP